MKFRCPNCHKKRRKWPCKKCGPFNIQLAPPKQDIIDLTPEYQFPVFLEGPLDFYYEGYLCLKCGHTKCELKNSTPTCLSCGNSSDWYADKFVTKYSSAEEITVREKPTKEDIKLINEICKKAGVDWRYEEEGQ